jgi:hypothetical protein
MNAKRFATVGAAGAVLAAMIAGAATSGARRAAPLPVAPPTRALDLRGDALAAEIARLRERLRPTTEPLEPARNLFQFDARPAARRGGAPASAAAEPAPPMLAPPIAPPPPPPPFTLVGLAVDAGPDGPVRTAIISIAGDVLLVQIGGVVGTHYVVSAIGADDVDLTSRADGSTLRLALK